MPSASEGPSGPPLLAFIRAHPYLLGSAAVLLLLCGGLCYWHCCRRSVVIVRRAPAGDAPSRRVKFRLLPEELTAARSGRALGADDADAEHGLDVDLDLDMDMDMDMEMDDFHDSRNDAHRNGADDNTGTFPPPRSRSVSGDRDHSREPDSEAFDESAALVGRREQPRGASGAL